MAAIVGITRKSELVWQVPQAAPVAIGMCRSGSASAENETVLPWHCEQSPVDGCAGSASAFAPPAAVGRVWKPLYCAPGVTTAGDIG